MRGLLGHVSANLRDWRRWAAFVALLPGIVFDLAYLRADVAEPVTLPALIIDRSLQLAIVAAVACWLCLMMAGKRFSDLAGIVAAAVSAAVIVTVLISAVRAPRDLVVLTLAVLALLPSIVAGAYLVRRTPTPFGIKNGGVIFAAVWALALPLLQLWQSTSFASYTEQVSVSLTPTVEVLEANDHDYKVLVSLTTKNASTFRAFVLGSEVRLCWSSEQTDLDAMLRSDDEQFCRRWQPIGRRNWIDATSELTVSKTFEVPRAMDKMVVGARATYARGDRLRLVAGSEDDEPLPGCYGTSYRYQLEEESKYKAMSQLDKFVVYGDRDGNGSVEIFLQDEDHLGCDQSDPNDLFDYFSLGSMRVSIEDWLRAPDVPQPDAPQPPGTSDQPADPSPDQPEADKGW